MSLTLNMVGGGVGGLTSTDALLRVQAPAGSTVTITKGSTTKTDQGHENADDSTIYDYYFIIHQSQFDSTTPWTVTATLNTQTASATVLISENAEYDLELSYGFYLYNNGDQCTAVTGGWSYAAFLSTSNYSAGTLDTAYNGTTCYLSANGVNKQISAVTVNKIDVTDYNALRIEVSDYTFAGSGYKELDLVSSRGDVSSYAAQVRIESTGTFTVDVSSITGSYYIGLYLNSGSAGSCAIGFTKMYLVK